MDFGLSDEQELLQQSARDFLTSECPTALVRETMASTDGVSRALQDKIAALGWPGLIVPEKFGGAGMGLLELAVLCEEIGRTVMPGPFLSSTLATLALLQTNAAAAKKTWIPRLASGSAFASLAFLEESDRCDAEGITLKVSKIRDGFRLQGTKMFVCDAQLADFLIVAARGRGKGEAGVCLFLVPTDTPGLTILPLESIDGTRRPSEVTFDEVEVPKAALIADEDQGWKILSRVLNAACILIAADCLGGSERVLELSVEYSKVREQFGRKIGSFQAVKHMAAEMVSEIEPARSLVWYAAYAYDHEPKRSALAASMAKARMSDVYMRSANTAVQIHGGIGFTWEHDMHLWFKRAKWNESAFGDASFHRERVARLAGF